MPVGKPPLRNPVPQLDVASFQREGTALQVVFVPPETSYFHDEQQVRLRNILIKALLTHKLTGELVAVWEFEGELNFMGNPHWAEFILNTGYAKLYGQRTGQISVR